LAESLRGHVKTTHHRSRTLFLSDIHLATRACRADVLLDFLRHHEAETIYLVGDIVDFWRIRRGAIWPQSHNVVVQALLDRVRTGTRLVFVPGNHDEGLRDYCGTLFSGVEIVPECVHTTADGRRLLVVHGDEFDAVVSYARWLGLLGGGGHHLARAFGMPLRWVRRLLGFGPWSLARHLKLKFKTAVNIIGEFEKALVAEAGRRGVDGIVCGHIHHAANRHVDGIQYLNCGDWVGSCTAIVEDDTGRLRLVDWRQAARGRQPDLAPGRRLQEAA
jgi:UDP-2,3-diacylglucosamine pyrophosphatase LpxH